ncbi:probable ADP-ribosylation factor GTPase-activating protein AGD8 [Amborella trichopoda]|uniref:probable ADP-ribosylation factor GTPase-activating protein AGD8 n=1 Tax=Amborella trichopoda TaxID=13333 RepID=UPI0009BCBD4F|nr:probable ADP-ribosylation factor GTPase-activating protein AGD8 [Amborella trichopoda]|eukprot:XP_020520131.1 probable ADP-ribosylation factor GTPase-activating protein AGD8 [Amborella trichopoda]
MKFTGTSKENDVADKHEAPEVTASPKTPHPITSTIKTPIGARIGSKTEGGLGAQKLTTKPSESLYDQKPEEPTLVVSSSTNASAAPSFSSLFPSLFEYVESMQSAVQRPILVVRKYLTMSLHLKSSNFFADFGMDSGIKNKPSSTYSTVQG